jgi:hypothetical protein
MADEKLDSLHSNFPKLTKENQQYIVGFAEGLVRAQDGQAESSADKAISVQNNTIEHPENS